jgi:hypothetical protein
LTEVNEYVLDIGTIYHNLLFSFQRSLKLHLGSRSGIFIHPALDHLLRMEEQGSLKIGNSKTLEEALSAFADFLVKDKIVEACSTERIGEDKYIFKVKGCMWAKKVHARYKMRLHELPEIFVNFRGTNLLRTISSSILPILRAKDQ